jgi:hypothetical protein
MALEDIVKVTVTASTKTPDRPGFGTPMIAAQSLPAGWGANRIRSFGSLTELVDAGIPVTHPVYKIASVLKSQNPAPSTIKVGKRTLLATRTVTLTITDVTAGKVYTFVVDGKTITYTVPSSGSPTVTTVAAAIAALVTGTPNSCSATNTAGVITITAAAGVVFDVAGFTEMAVAVADTTADPGIATDLAALQAEDGNWYGLLLDCGGKAEILAAAAWAEANQKLAAFDVVDTAAMDPASTTDVLFLMKGLSYARSGGWVVTSNLLALVSAGIMGSRLPANPGSDTWKFKTLAGVPSQKMTEGQKSAVFAKHGNTYTTIAGINMTEEGWTAAGEFYDVTRFIDWTRSEMKIRVFGLLVNSEKVPYTDAGVDMVTGVMGGVLTDGVTVGGLDKGDGTAANPGPQVTAPKVTAIDPTIRATRKLTGIKFKARLAGAIHSLEIDGTLSV